MTFTKPNDPAAGVNPASYGAQSQPDKVDWDIVVGGIAGTGIVSGCAVTAQATPNMTVAVAAGTTAVLSAQHAVTGANVTVGTADATNPRIDLIVASSSGVLSCQAGTASSVPCTPNVPAASVALAEIYVPAGATTITSAQIRDCRVPISTNVPTIHKITRSRQGTITTTTVQPTRTPLDATLLGFQYVTLAVGDLVKCMLACVASNTVTAWGVGFDFEVDQPVSANVYISPNDFGLSRSQPSATAGVPIPFLVLGEFVATEAGSHGFRPVWMVEGNTGEVYNAVSGVNDQLITFSFEKWPAALVV